MYNEMHMYALLVCMPVYMEVYGLQPIAEMESPEVRMSKALHAMRCYFADVSATPVDQQVILDIFMSIAEFFRSNFTAMRTHLRMIRYLVDSLGGLDRLSQVYPGSLLLY
jgi:archaellum biogenesis protein FlaJ (TadC family)